jgi:hypothetical protein
VRTLNGSNIVVRLESRMIGKRKRNDDETARVVSVAARTLLLFTALFSFALGPAAAQFAGDDENDAACAMMASYAKMGVDHAQFVALAPHCAKSPHCAATRQTMTTAGRPDVDMLNCDQAPALAPNKAAAERASKACYELLARAMPPMAVPITGKEPDIVRLVQLCSTSPDPRDQCQALDAFNAAKLSNPGLACKR